LAVLAGSSLSRVPTTVVPDPFGQSYGLPRLPLEPIQVGMKQNTVASAPEQEFMEQLAPKPQGEPICTPEAVETQPGCIPCISASGKTETNRHADAEQIKKNKNSFCVKCCGCARANQTLDEEEMLNHHFWCIYCCCAGVGLGPFVHQRLLLRCACVLIECDDTECFGKEGFASCISSCCCLHLLGHVPPRHRTPVCMCWNEMFGRLHSDSAVVHQLSSRGKHPSSGDDLNAFNSILTENDNFTICYYRICGCAVSPPEFVGTLRGKCGSCQCEAVTGAPCDEDKGCCICFWTCTWLYWYFRIMPPLAHVNPHMALLGCKLSHVRNHFHHHVLRHVLPAHGVENEEDAPSLVREVVPPRLREAPEPNFEGLVARVNSEGYQVPG